MRENERNRERQREIFDQRLAKSVRKKKERNRDEMRGR